MIAFVYCPATGQKVQGHVADELIDGATYEAVTCTPLRAGHLVNPKTDYRLLPLRAQYETVDRGARSTSKPFERVNVIKTRGEFA